MAQQIKPELLKKWQKKGELLVIWRCDRCYKKIPFYKSGNEFIDGIYLWWAHDHKYCPECRKKLEGNNLKPKENPNDKRIKDLLDKYELPLEEEDYY